MAWSDFAVTPEQVQERHPGILNRITADELVGFIVLAKNDVEEDRLLSLVEEKHRDFGKVVPDDLPDEPLDAIQDAAYTQIRKLVIYRTLHLVYLGSDGEEDGDEAAKWDMKYKEQSVDRIQINIDIDDDDDISAAEHYDIQAQLDNPTR